MTELFEFLNTVQPVGVIALLGVVIYMLVRQQLNVKTVEKGQQNLADNHLHELPEIANTLRRMEAKQSEIAEHIVYVRARVNGK